MTRTVDDWFNEIAALAELPPSALQDLLDSGFVVLPGPLAPDGLAQLAETYDAAWSRLVVHSAVALASRSRRGIHFEPARRMTRRCGR